MRRNEMLLISSRPKRFLVSAIATLGLFLVTATSYAGDASFTPSPMVSFLKLNVGSSCLLANQENYIFANTIYPPGHPKYHSILPTPDPSPGVFWGVMFTPAPYTVRNTTDRPIDVLWNVYSDNVYAY